ncbi:ABC transporter transmembrane domain-containing protein [Anaerocolumna chitinilytica]|uniref:Multidrug ABC transporter ATP-binding protein n=1 Tax=Anaerocolumna chitinilytica TaxID=1727145 RepID=A0A7I8DQT8_9FIRM|nr:ABC transporter ATP-binding protein [Anaerocolumna chitinilytica]BCK00038.1 multidrug ABC transporter ATP-binding protein [Anaerocolumna chitinilytica]
MKKYASLFTLFISTSITVWGISILMPFVSGRLIDVLVSDSHKSRVYQYVAIVAVMNIINLVVQYFVDLSITKLNGKIAFDLSYHVYKNIKKAPLSFFENADSVYLSTRINEDSNCIINFFVRNCVSFITNILTIFFGFIMIFQISPVITILFIVIMIAYIIIYKAFRQPLYQSNFTLIEKRNQYFSVMTEQFKLIKYIKLNSLFSIFDENLIKRFKDVFNTVMNNFRLNYLFSNLAAGVLVLANIIIIFFGGIKVINKEMTIGNFTILSTYFNLVLTAVHYFIEYSKSYQQTLVSVKRMEQMNEVTTEHNGSIRTDGIEFISVQNLDFKFEHQKKLIQNLSCTMTKGNIYCIYGSNGSGKSTFLNIIANLYNSYQGNIFINSYNIKEMDMYYLRECNMAYSDQAVTMVRGSIYENLTYGLNNQEKLREKVIYWCKRFNLYDKIISMPDGFESDIAADYITLSGGEKAKISFIRALVKDTPILILDEPTAAFDKESVTILKECLLEIKSGKIILLITHDQSIADIADEIIQIG